MKCNSWFLQLRACSWLIYILWFVISLKGNYKVLTPSLEWANIWWSSEFPILHLGKDESRLHKCNIDELGTHLHIRWQCLCKNKFELFDIARRTLWIGIPEDLDLRTKLSCVSKVWIRTTIPYLYSSISIQGILATLKTYFDTRST